MVALAARHGVPCLIDCCGDFRAAGRLAGAFPQAKLIVAHLGQYLCTDEALIDRFIDLAAAHGNVILDVSGVVLPLSIRRAVERIGSERVAWGTDGPRRAPDTVDFARMELDRIRALDLGRKQTDDLLGGTIARLLAG